MLLRRAACALMAIGLLACISPGASAQDPIHAFGRGAVNLLAGWVELPRQTVEGGKSGGVAGTFRGFWKGSRRFGLRTWLGGKEALAAPLAWWRHDETLYERHEIPDYPWQ